MLSEYEGFKGAVSDIIKNINYIFRKMENKSTFENIPEDIKEDLSLISIYVGFLKRFYEMEI